MSNFDRIAQHYRWMEALSFGTSLQRCRTCFLSELGSAQEVLIFGEGDGRFLKELVLHNRNVRADVVDSSEKMLALAKMRIDKFSLGVSQRVNWFHCDALSFATDQKYDAIVTNFFLDCLSEVQVEVFVQRITRSLKPSGLWVVGDFSIPRGKLRFVARPLVASLYFAFRLLAELRVSKLPNFEKAFKDAGLTKLKEQPLLLGILTAHIWEKTP